MSPNIYLPARIETPSGARHFLSNDPIDERVIEEIIGSLSNLFFPRIGPTIVDELNRGAYILDVGAFNGGWGIEMLLKYPFANGIFMEPNPEKYKILLSQLEEIILKIVHKLFQQD